MTRTMTLAALALVACQEKEPVQDPVEPQDTEPQESSEPEESPQPEQEVLDASGAWSGGCEAYIPGDDYEGTLLLDLTLEDEAGSISGTGESWSPDDDHTQYTVTGERTETELLLLLGYADSGRLLPGELRLVLEEDALVGDLVVFPEGTSGYDPMFWPCELLR
jgi:hypothetical protein